MKSCDLRNECKSEFRFIQCIHVHFSQNSNIFRWFTFYESTLGLSAIYGLTLYARGTHMSFQREHLKYVQYHRNYARIRELLRGCYAFGVRWDFQPFPISMQASELQWMKLWHRQFQSQTLISYNVFWHILYRIWENRRQCGFFCCQINCICDNIKTSSRSDSKIYWKMVCNNGTEPCNLGAYVFLFAPIKVAPFYAMKDCRPLYL